MKHIVILITLTALSGCAILHHVQVGEIDNRVLKGRKFDIKVSETGVDAEEAGKVVDAFSRKNQGSEIANYVAMFQYGPRTGNPVYNERYAEKVISLIHKECPSGKISGLNSIRETRSYPVISGEIVKITGWCLK